MGVRGMWRRSSIEPWREGGMAGKVIDEMEKGGPQACPFASPFVAGAVTSASFSAAFPRIDSRISCARAWVASSRGYTRSCTVSRTLCTFSLRGSGDVRIAEMSWMVVLRDAEMSLNEDCSCAGRVAVECYMVR